MGTEEAAQANNFIDATAQDVTAQPKPSKKPGILEVWLKAAADKLKPAPAVLRPATVYQSVVTPAPAVGPEPKPQQADGYPSRSGWLHEPGPKEPITAATAANPIRNDAPHYHPMTAPIPDAPGNDPAPIIDSSFTEAPNLPPYSA